MANKVIFGSSSIVLSWQAPATANKYQLQVSSTPDFSGTLMVDDATLTSATKSFTDSGVNDSKRWWRWRWSSNGGTTWSSYREVASYWRRTSATELADPVTSEGWYLISDATTSDVRLIEPFPRWKITSARLDRSRTRNRAGDMLTEYLTFKDHIEANFPEETYIEPDAVHEVTRFAKVVKTFFLACFRKNGQDAWVVPQIWRCQFESDPEFEMMASGQYIAVGSLAFEEV